MKPKTLIATILIAFGILGFTYQGFRFMIVERDVSGSIRMTTERTYPIPLAPIFGAIALIGGIAMLLVDKNDFKSTATP